MFGAIAGGIASALAVGAMSKLFGGGQKAASGVFFCNDPASTDIYTLSLHDALPISRPRSSPWSSRQRSSAPAKRVAPGRRSRARSEEHTSERQSRRGVVCRRRL